MKACDSLVPKSRTERFMKKRQLRQVEELRRTENGSMIAIQVANKNRMPVH